MPVQALSCRPVVPGVMSACGAHYSSWCLQISQSIAKGGTGLASAETNCCGYWRLYFLTKYNKQVCEKNWVLRTPWKFLGAGLVSLFSVMSNSIKADLLTDGKPHSFHITTTLPYVGCYAIFIAVFFFFFRFLVHFHAVCNTSRLKCIIHVTGQQTNLVF